MPFKISHSPLSLRLAMTVLAVIAFFSAGLQFVQAGNTAQTHLVHIRDLKFVPDDITIARGDRVKWVNLDIVPHTATAQDNSWDSDLIAANSIWEMTLYQEDTVFHYYCAYHPTMRGRITVK